MYDLAIASVSSAQDDIKVKSKSFSISTIHINKHIIALHDKFALGLMCIILFFVGAPLGALIRKGGIGLLHKSLQTRLTASTSSIVISIDLKAAFQSVLRSTVHRAVSKHAPWLVDASSTNSSTAPFAISISNESAF